MSTNKKRKLPIGWRRLTPTEKITSECKYCGKERYIKDNPPIEYWSYCSMDIGKLEKDSAEAFKYVVITPIKKPNTNEQTTEQSTTTTTIS